MEVSDKQHGKGKGASLELGFYLEVSGHCWEDLRGDWMLRGGLRLGTQHVLGAEDSENPPQVDYTREPRVDSTLAFCLFVETQGPVR